MDRKTTPATEDLGSALRSLANRLTLKARDNAADAKRKPAGDAHGDYLRGLAEGYYKSALELAEIIKKYGTESVGSSGLSDAPGVPVMPGAASRAAAASAAPPPPQFEAMPINEVIRLLSYVDANPRDVTPNKDNSYTAIFSRWQPLSDGERLAKIKSMDLRVVVLANGKTKDSNDPFVVFAFKSG
ncbi:MAG: hypothetical protein SF123_07010 [Chloroflexota bacterium]|nr:hypothetical protein [Chloroflexota bacterium]